MKSLILLTLCSLALTAQSAPDPVIVVIDGHAWTRNNFDAMVRALPPELQQGYMANKKMWLEQYALMTRLAESAKKDGIDQKAPYKQQLEYNNLMFLAQAYLDAKSNAPLITDADMQHWFDAHKNQYKRAKVRGIAVRWGQVPKEGEKPRTATEAQTVAEDIIKRVKAGESFVDLAKQLSEDTNTKDKGGEYPLIRPEDGTINASIKSAVFALKPGELSKPVRMPGAIYVFQLEELVDPTVKELNDTIITEIGREQSIQWVEKNRQNATVEIKDPTYFGLPDNK